MKTSDSNTAMSDEQLIVQCETRIRELRDVGSFTIRDLTELLSRFQKAQKENEGLKRELQNALEFLLLTKGSDKIELAKSIIAQIFSLFHYAENGHKPAGYGNWELNKATDAMYDYIKEMTPLPNLPNATK